MNQSTAKSRRKADASAISRREVMGGQGGVRP